MRWILMLAAIILCCPLSGQDTYKIGNVEVRQFSISSIEQGDVEFIIASKDTLLAKPAFLLLQGSRPVPLIIDYGDAKDFSLFPFDISPILEDYHLVVISKPFVPVIAGVDSLVNGFIYADILKQYSKANHLDTYISRTHLVLDFLTKESYVDTDRLLVFGHSEGSTVAVKVADHPSITHVALGACNPLGRVYQDIIETRVKEDVGVISSEEAQSLIEEKYNRWNYIVNNKNDTSSPRGDTFKTTYSFSEYLVDDMIRMKQPLLITYGTKDLAARSSDYLPIALPQGGKTNYTLKPYIGRGHNYESFLEDGSSNFDDMAWDDVIQSILDWVK